MQFRNFGKSGINVSDVGYGAWGIGKSMWIGATDDESLRSLAAARDAGVNFFDTALAYGEGHSEQLIARAFGKSAEVIIAMLKVETTAFFDCVMRLPHSRRDQ